MKELLKKIQQVSAELKSIEKDMTVGKGQSSYKAVSDLSVVLKVKEAEQKAGIISIPIKQELISSEVVRTQKQDYNTTDMIEKVNYVDVIKLTLEIFDLESDDSITIESFGRGLDAGDKGFGKAATYARKYALLNAYKIATGEDPDSDPSDKGNNIITQKDKSVKVLDYLEKNNKYHNEVLKHFGVESSLEFSDAQINSIYGILTKKGKL